MKKSIFILVFTLTAIMGFETESYAQTITLQNDVAANIDVTVCTTTKTLAAGEIYMTSSTCTAAPCSINITTPCTGTVTMPLPCGGTGPYNASQTFYGGGFPVCLVNVDYSYDTSGDIIVHVY